MQSLDRPGYLHVSHKDIRLMADRVCESNLDKEVRAHVEPRLQRWAAWSRQGNTSPLLKSQLSNLVRTDIDYHHRDYCLLSTTDEEGLYTDKDVLALPADERDAVIVEWLRAGTIAQKADDCGCRVPAYYRRLARAYQRLYNQWFS